jgi:isocitrate/isopropylmalate dehydrogenase
MVTISGDASSLRHCPSLHLSIVIMTAVYSDALAAQVGGIGIAPGGNINYSRFPILLSPK